MNTVCVCVMCHRALGLFALARTDNRVCLNQDERSCNQLTG